MPKKQKKSTNYFGWYGVLAILLAYFLISTSEVKAHSVIYQLLNLTGALGIMVEALSKRDTQPAILNAIWAIIAVVVLVSLAHGH